jgi:hypothetical protein
VILIVWFGVKAALSASQGGGGFHFAKFADLILMIAFGLGMLTYYSTPIPGTSYSFSDLITKEGLNIANQIESDQTQQIANAITNEEQELGSPPGSFNILEDLTYLLITVILATMEAVAFGVIAYGYVASAVCVLIGPVFIPWFIVPKMDWLFWGWLKAFIGFSFYQVVAAAFIYVFSKVLTGCSRPSARSHLERSYRPACAADFALRLHLRSGQNPRTHQCHPQRPRRHLGQRDGRVIMPKTHNELPITDAGHKFLELYAEPVVTNTYLKVAILVLSVVTLASLALLYRAQTAALRLKPLVISISDIGRGQVVNYADFSKVPVERVSKYYLARWAQLYYGRNHATLQRDFAESLNFFSNELQGATLARVTKAKTLETFLLDPSAPNVDIEIKAVVLDDTRQAPYRAHIEFEKVFYSLGDQQEQSRERWTANVVYGFRDEVPNAMLLTNPLGVVISYVHEDQAFGS